jgi:hypothetical protein
VRWLAVICAVAGCGRVGFESTAAGNGDANDASDGDAVAGATSRHWVKVTPTQSPPKLSRIAMTYHPVRQTVIVLGGYANPSGPSEQAVWEYDGTTWTQLCAICPPGRRNSAAMVFDPIRNKLVLFGGESNAGAFLNDLWEWDGTTWEQRAVTGGPPPLSHATFVWDPVGQRALLMGGFTDTGVFPTDMWSYDGTTWTTIPTNTPPIDAAGPHAVWDSANARVVAYGAQYTSMLRDEAWTWSGTDWTSLCTQCTGTPRIAASLAYAPGMGVLIVGGFIPMVNEIAGTWRLNGTTFEQVSGDPTARDTQGLAYDIARDVIVSFGGNGSGCGGDCNETWEYVPD